MGIKFRQTLTGFLASQHAAMHIESDRVHPGGDHVFMAKLRQSFPSLHPGGLRHVARQIPRHSPGDQEPDRELESALISLSVGFSGHLAEPAPSWFGWRLRAVRRPGARKSGGTPKNDWQVSCSGEAVSRNCGPPGCNICRGVQETAVRSSETEGFAEHDPHRTS